MSTHIRFHAALALSAALLAAAPAAHSRMYRWTDPHGAVTYSNQLPGDMSTVTDFSVVMDSPDETVDAKPEKRTGETQRAPAPSASSDTRRPTLGEALDNFERNDKGSDAIAPQPSPRMAISPGAPDAVRDPCLRSSDPKCYERNKAAYVPGYGYMPASAIGATISTAGGSGGGSGPSRLIAPRPSAYALPPGSELPAITTTRH